MTADSAAERLRHYSEQSNALHRTYADDAELLARYERLIEWQLDYMLPFYEDLRESPEYAAAVEFVVADLTGTGISKRDQDIARVVPVMCRMLPDNALDVVAMAMELNARVLEINLSICHELYDQLSPEVSFDVPTYWKACRQASSLDISLELIALTADVGQRLDHVIRIPMIGMTLKAMRTPARLAGFAALQSFLERGYTIFHSLEDVDEFLDVLIERMIAIFTEIFTAPCDG